MRIVYLFSLSLLFYFVQNHLLIPVNAVFSFPVHKDDFVIAAQNLETVELNQGRPLSNLIAALVASCGLPFLFLFPAIATAIQIFLIIYLGEKLTKIKLNHVFLILLLISIMSHPHSFEWGKYLGLLTNLTSAIFGLVSMLCLIRARNQESASRSSRIWELFHVLFFTLSLFCKEDYAICIVFLSLYLWFANPKNCEVPTTKLRRRKLLSFWPVGIGYGVSFLCYTFYNNIFAFNTILDNLDEELVLGSPYSVSLNPISLFTVFREYYFSTNWIFVVSIIFIVAFVFSCFRSHKNLRIFSLIGALSSAPYLALHNHIMPYYTFSWSAYMLVFVFYLIQDISQINKMTKMGAVIGSFIIASGLFYQGRSENLYTIPWYANRAAVNRRIVEGILDYKDKLVKSPYVGVLGAQIPHPFDGLSIIYLNNQIFAEYNTKIKWMVFESVKNPYFKSEDSLDGFSEFDALFFVSGMICKFNEVTNMPLIKIDEVGRVSIIERYCEQSHEIMDRQ